MKGARREGGEQEEDEDKFERERFYLVLSAACVCKKEYTTQTPDVLEVER
jgi:hypothetical protein